jgi:hypothetical protein
MPFPRYRVARTLAVALLAFLCVTVTARAAPKAFGQADAAWHQGELEQANKLYEQALSEGGLEPKDVVLAYSRVGTVKAALNDQNGALSAFRVAAAIDPNFELPAESGPKARKLFEKARAEAAQLGGEKLAVTLKVPEDIPARQAFTVETEIPPGFAVLVSEVVVAIEDPVTGKKWKRKKPSEPTLTFDFPKRAAISGARLKVRAMAVDAQNNAWAVTDAKIKVEGSRSGGGAGSWEGDDDPFAEKKQPQKEKKEDFFSGPIPWIAGGAVILVAIIGYAVLKPSDEVSVGSPSWK